MPRRWLLSLVAVAVAVLWASGARAETLEELDARLEAELGAKEPSAVAPFHAANEARKRGDHREARRLYDEVLKVAPRFTPALRRACEAQFELRNRDDALLLCRQAVEQEASPLNLVTLATVLAVSADAPEEMTEAMVLATRAVDGAAGDAYILASACEVALDAHDVPLIQRTADALEKAGQGEGRELVCRAVAAATRGKLAEADALAEEAERHGADAEIVERVRSSVRAIRPLEGRVVRFGAGLLAIEAAVLAASFTLAFLFGGLILRRAQGGRSIPAWMRRIDDTALRVLALAGVLIAPLFVGLALAGLAATLSVYASRGQVPLPLLCASLCLSGAVAGARLLFLRPLDDALEMKLDRSSHPKLVELVEDVGRAVGVRPPMRLTLAAGADVQSFERGRVAELVIGLGNRGLSFGAAGLRGLKVGELRGLLAHELAHFRGRDAIFARAVGVELARWSEGHHASSWWATRTLAQVFALASARTVEAQEREADERAILVVGAATFAGALRHVTRRDVQHQAELEAALTEAPRGESPVNLYDLDAPETADIRGELEAAMERPPARHPVASPAARIAAAGEASAEGSPREGDDALAWTLFDDRDGLERALTEIVLEETSPAPQRA